MQFCKWTMDHGKHAVRSMVCWKGVNEEEIDLVKLQRVKPKEEKFGQVVLREDWGNISIIIPLNPAQFIMSSSRAQLV